MAELVDSIPYAAEVYAILVAISALVVAVVPSDKMPRLLSAVLNFLAFNVGHARNAERPDPDPMVEE